MAEWSKRLGRHAGGGARTSHPHPNPHRLITCGAFEPRMLPTTGHRDGSWFARRPQWFKRQAPTRRPVDRKAI